MNPNEPLALLRDAAGQALALQGVAIDVALRDLAVEVTAVQRYRKPRDTNVEVVCTFPLPSEAETAEVLLITDGEIWQAEALIEKAARARQRVFVVGVGVGSAVSEASCAALRRRAGAPASWSRRARTSPRGSSPSSAACSHPEPPRRRSHGQRSRRGAPGCRRRCSPATRCISSPGSMQRWRAGFDSN
jgi:hypothetical protein